MSILVTTLASYTNLLSQTWGARWGGRVSAIVDQSPLLALAFIKGATHFEDAPYATRPFTHAKNPNIQTYAGTETLNAATFQHTKLLKWEQWGQISCQNVVPTDEIDLAFKAPERAATIVPSGDSDIDYLCLVMPLRLLD